MIFEVVMKFKKKKKSSPSFMYTIIETSLKIFSAWIKYSVR